MTIPIRRPVARIDINVFAGRDVRRPTDPAQQF